ncbi:MAG TPA: HAD hydrolase-like protein [Actinomycetaceae bacterium]|nr:HAD hydrolase-like protein [Actinomycetaceae bacterium]
MPAVPLSSSANGAVAPSFLDPSVVVFDLDGTISDSGAVITSSIAETLSHFGYPVPGPAGLLQFVGPPIRQGFLRLGGVGEAHVDEVVADYRRRYRTRLTQAPVFSGMASLLGDLHNRGVPLAIATSKRQSMAEEVLANDGLIELFVVVCGAAEDESRGEKVDIIADALSGLRENRIDLSRPIMVGDRHHDVQGALTHGIDAVLVEWGYGQAGEDDGAVAVAHTVAELRAMLIPSPRS